MDRKSSKLRLRRPVLPALLALLALLPVHGAADVDDLQSQLLTQYQLPMRWENVETAPEWIAGIKPRRDHHLHLHVVDLAPGAATTIRIPPGALIRVVNPHGALQSEDIDLGLSDGSGLYVSLNMVRSTDGQSLLANPDATRSMLARVERPASHNCSITVALFGGRYSALDEIAPYRCLVLLSSPHVTLRRCDETLGKKYWPAGLGDSPSVAMVGPARLAVATRLAYPPREARTDQHYQVRVFLDGRLHQILDHETGLESRRVVVEHGDAVVGREQIGYVEIPAGAQRVTFDATAPAYLRVTAQKEPDYLAPGLNEPRVSPALVRQGLGTLLDPWDLSAQQAQSIAAKHPTDLEDLARLGRRLARDNSYREGGIVGTMLLRRAAQERPDYPEVRAVADQLRAHHTFYRDLRPIFLPPASPSTQAWFLDRRLRNPGEARLEPIVPSQHQDDVLDQLGRGLFCVLPASAQEALTYPVPERFGPSQLRLAAIAEGASAPAEFFVQLDDQHPMRLLALPAPELPASVFQPGSAEATLAAMPGFPRSNGPPTLGGAFSRTRLPAPMLPAGVAELPLPAGVRTVRLWSAAAQPPLLVAAQYRTSKPARFSEMEYLEMLRRATGPLNPQQLLTAWLQGKPGPGYDPVAERELGNYWLPLQRLLKDRSRGYRAAVVTDSERTLSKTPPPADAAALVRQAQASAKAGEHLTALAAWSKLLPRPIDEERRLALFGRVDALLALGESFLAERHLRGMFVHDPDERVREEARGRLAELYAKAGDTGQLEALFALEALRRPTPAILRSLAEALLANGEDEWALIVGAVLPPAERPTGAVLQAAYQQRWWEHFDRLVGSLSDDAERRLWQAHQALARDHTSAALELFRGAGARGTVWAEALEQALRIHADLAAPDCPRRLQALSAWQDWQANHPGPHAWREDPSLIVDSAGMSTVYTIGRDLYGGFHVSQPNRPVKMKVVGPVRLKLEVRPVHPRGAVRPIDDWLVLRRAGGVNFVPISDNFPSLSFKVVGAANRVPGVELTPEVELGPGLHEIEVAAEHHLALVRVYAWRPVLPLGVLPPLTPATLAPVLATCDPGHVAEVLAAKPFAHPSTANAQTVSLFSRQAAHLSGGKISEALAEPIEAGEAGIRQRMTMLLRWAETDPAQRLRAQILGEALFAAQPTTPGLQSLHDRLLRRSAWAPVTAVQSSAGVRRVGAFGWAPESPALRARQALLGTFPPSDLVVAGHDRFILSMTNLRPTLLTVSMKLEDVAHLPPAPARAALQVDDGEAQSFVLGPGKDRQAVQVSIPPGMHSVRVGLEQTVANQVLRLRFEESQPQHLTAAERVLTFAAAAVAGPPAALAGAAASLDPPRKEIVRGADRTYHLASREQPLRLRVEGPAWLRIDELRDNVTKTHYRLVETGVQTVEFKPGAEQQEALLRVFQRQAALDEPVILPRNVPTAPLPVPPPLVTLASLPSRSPIPVPPEAAVVAEPRPVILQDTYALGAQEDGTWSIWGRYVRRRALEEDSNDSGRGGAPDEFGELRATHRFWNEWCRVYSETDILGRERAAGGPTLGLLEHVRYNPPYLPFVVHGEGSVYVQQPGATRLPGRGDTEASMFLRGRISRHYDFGPQLTSQLSVAAFGRLLSLQDDPYEPGHLDQDVFTRYKGDHRAGLELADTMVYRPWLDAELWGRLALTNNENFVSPDHLTAQAGWRQLLGRLELGAAYRATSYFKDNDRDQAATRHLIETEMLWDFDCRRRNLWQLGVRYEYDLSRAQGSIFVHLAWHLLHGREYRDFRPGAVNFADLRRRTLAERLLTNQLLVAE